MPSVLSFAAPRIVAANRRTDVRVPACELPWLRAARVASGPSISLINLSRRGALFEIPRSIRPGQDAAFELDVDGERTMSSSVIVRSEIAEIRPDAVRYRGACMFADPLPWGDRLCAKPLPEDLTLPSEPYVPWTGWSECAVLLRHGRRRFDGYTHSFSPWSGTVMVAPTPGASEQRREEIPLTLVRAVLFRRDVGDAEGVASAGAPSSPGRAAEIVFHNNQRLHGTILSYAAGEPGFWVLPTRSQHILRVFAVSPAVAEIRVYT